MGPSSLFSTRLESRHDVVRVSLHGELDLASAPILERDIASVESNGAKVVMLDLRELRFIDSTGLSTLLDAKRRADTNGHRLVVIGAPPAAQRLFEITGTQNLMTDAGAVEFIGMFTDGPDPEARRDPAGSPAPHA